MNDGGSEWPASCGAVCCLKYHNLQGECGAHMMEVFFDVWHLKSKVELYCLLFDWDNIYNKFGWTKK